MKCELCKNECDSIESYQNHVCQGMSDEDYEELNRCNACGLIREECNCPLEEDENCTFKESCRHLEIG